MKTNRMWAVRALTVSALVLLQACASAPGGREGASPSAFPAPENAWPKEGTSPDPEHLRLLRQGMTKDQLYGLLGTPHFNEGFFNVREWHYLFQISANGAAPADAVTCQLKVRFDQDMRAASYQWKPESCAEPQPVPLRAHALPVQALKHAVLSGDVLFSFNGSSLNDITPQGRRQLEKLAAEIGGFKNVSRIEISAYADRIGSDAYNLALTQKRAMSVQALLVRSGFDAGIIQARGLGKSSPPVSQCGPLPQAELIPCTAPDRRVEIQVFGIH